MVIIQFFDTVVICILLTIDTISFCIWLAIAEK